MKKTILFFLLMAGTASLLPAQSNIPDASEMLFNTPPSGKANAVFSFYLPNKRRLMVEFTNISQINFLPDADSLVQAAAKLLLPLKDSLKADGMVRRVDMVMTSNFPRIRIINHPEFSNSFTVRENELLQLKVNQDTIRIIGYAKTGKMVNFSVDGEIQKRDFGGQFVITLILDNVEDISSLPANTVEQCLTLLKPKISSYANTGKSFLGGSLEFRADFNMRTGQMFSPANGRFIRVRERSFEPYIGFSYQYVRGAFVPGLQLGYRYNYSNAYSKNSFRLYQELETFFSRDSNQKLQIDKNEFVVFQFSQVEKSKTNQLSLAGNFTLGYLYQRRGEWYEPHTFKLGLPILTSKHISIEPQFVFNGWFKNMSPAIKIVFHF